MCLLNTASLCLTLLMAFDHTQYFLTHLYLNLLFDCFWVGVTFRKPPLCWHYKIIPSWLIQGAFMISLALSLFFFCLPIFDSDKIYPRVWGRNFTFAAGCLGLASIPLWNNPSSFFLCDIPPASGVKCLRVLGSVFVLVSISVFSWFSIT